MRVQGICLSILLLISSLSGILQASQINSLYYDRYVILRAFVAPMYIENESAPVKVLAMPFQNNKPVTETVDIIIKIKGVNVDYKFNQTYRVMPGRAEIIYLPAMKQGHYNINIVARWGLITSKPTEQDFAVSPPPDPYILYITQDGSKIVFESQVLNETGEIDPNVTFTLEIYSYQHGLGESLITTYRDVTNITINIPEGWKHGILIVEVVDRNGWRNGASVDLSAFRFSGEPVMYDYEYAYREPFKSRQIWYGVAAFLVVIVLFVAMSRIDRGGKHE